MPPVRQAASLSQVSRMMTFASTSNGQLLTGFKVGVIEVNDKLAACRTNGPLLTGFNPCHYPNFRTKRAGLFSAREAGVSLKPGVEAVAGTPG
jgi:hypothetical protein